MSNKKRNYLFFLLLIFCAIIVIGFYAIHPQQDLIVCFDENAILWEGVSRQYIFKDDTIIALELIRNEQQKANYYMYRIRGVESDAFLYKHLNSKGDVDLPYPELAYRRVDIFWGRKKPHNIEYYDNTHIEMRNWFNEIKLLICKEENKVNKNELPAFLSESQWFIEYFEKLIFPKGDQGDSG